MDERFVKLYEMNEVDVFRLAYSYTKKRVEAEDAVQNAFVKLYEHEDIMCLSNDEVRRWLFRVTINECKTAFLSAWRRRVRGFDEAFEVGGEEKKIDEVLEEVMKLPTKYRLVVYLYYYLDYQAKEIAIILGISETNVQTRLARARDKLLETLKEGME